MAKFLSFDGIDNQGVRAEVMVQTGTGRIKELIPKGKPSENGTYRNFEVVFDPDNPHLKRKVYALLDTTAKELWEYVQAAQADQRDISYRIESQRKRNVDRTKKFDDLIHTEEVVRVLASLDNVFSHEAKTNPKEDPSGENPSALDQDLPATGPITIVGAAPAAPAAAADPATVLAGLAAARKAELPATTVDTLVALALAAGADLDDVLAAGLDNESPRPAPTAVSGRVAASEEKPWMPYNSDGRINAGSYMVAHAASAERFALDHLVTVYSEGKKTAVDVSEAMIAQAASVALVLLEITDTVQAQITGRADRQKNSYNRVMSLVLDAVDKRHRFPVGANSEAQATWRDAVIAEAGERLYGVLEVAQGRLPLPADQRTATPVVEAPAPAKVAEPVQAPAEAAQAPAKAAPAAKPAPAASGADLLVAELGASPIKKAAPAAEGVEGGFVAPEYPAAGTDGFVEPTEEQVARVRALCVNADAGLDAKAISDWLERDLGVRATRKVHAPALEAFLSFYEAAGPAAVRSQILGAPTAA